MRYSPYRVTLIATAIKGSRPLIATVLRNTTARISRVVSQRLYIDAGSSQRPGYTTGFY